MARTIPARAPAQAVTVYAATGSSRTPATEATPRTTWWPAGCTTGDRTSRTGPATVTPSITRSIHHRASIVTAPRAASRHPRRGVTGSGRRSTSRSRHLSNLPSAGVAATAAATTATTPAVASSADSTATGTAAASPRSVPVSRYAADRHGQGDRR